MDNSESFSLDSNLPHSFFSSFSSTFSTTSTWKPLLTSLQENQRLNRLIQVRETRLQELSSNTNIPVHSRLSSGPFNEDLGGCEQDRLSEILHLSQKNLKILSFKVGTLPNNLLKAIDLVLDDPISMTTTQKIECLSAIELLREKLSEMVLNSEEILSFFKDIALECEASAGNFKSGQEGLLLFADKREEIFLSKDLNRVKIQNLHRLVMNLESWKRRKGIFVEELDSNSRIQYDECIKETIEKLGKKEQEVIDIQNQFHCNLNELREKVKNLKIGLKRLRHCVEFEMFNTWSSLIGQEFSNEPSCHQIIGKISSFQQNVQVKNKKTRNRFEEVRKIELDNKRFFFLRLGEFKMFLEKNFRLALTKILEQENIVKQVQEKLYNTEVERNFFKEKLEEMTKEKQKIQQEMKENSKFFQEEIKKIRKSEKDKKLEILENVKKFVGWFKTTQKDTQQKFLKIYNFFSYFLEKFEKILETLKISNQIRLDHYKTKSEIDQTLIIFLEDLKKGLKSSLFSLFSTILSLIKSSKFQICEEKTEIQQIVFNFSQNLEVQINQLGKSGLDLKKLVNFVDSEKKKNENLLKIEISELNLEVKNLNSQLVSLQESKEKVENLLKTSREEFSDHFKDFEKQKAQLEYEKSILAEKLMEIQTKIKKIEELSQEKEKKLHEKLLEITENFEFKEQEMSQKFEEMEKGLKKDLALKDQVFHQKSEELSFLTSEFEENLRSLKSLQQKVLNLEKENLNLNENLKTLSTSNDSNLKKIDSLSSSLKSANDSLIQKSSELSETSSSLQALQEKSLNLSKDLSQKTSLLESLSNHLKDQENLNKSLHLDSLQKTEKLKKAKDLESRVKILKLSNQELFRFFADFRVELSRDLESFKDFVASSSQGQEEQSLKILALENCNSHLQTENSRLNALLLHQQEGNCWKNQRNHENRMRIMGKLAKIKRKTRTFALVLAHERGLIKDLHLDWMTFMRNSLENFKIIIQSFQELKVVDDKKFRIEIQKIMKDSQDKCRNFQIQINDLVENMTEKEEKFEICKKELMKKLENVTDEKNKNKKKLEDLQVVNQQIMNETLENSRKFNQNERELSEKLLKKEQENQENYRKIENLMKENQNLNQVHLEFQERSEMVKNDLIGKIQFFEENEKKFNESIEKLEMQKSTFDEFLNESDQPSAETIKKLLNEKTEILKNYETKVKQLESLQIDLEFEILNKNQLKTAIENLKSENAELRTHSQSQQLELGFLLTGRNFAEKSNSEKDAIFKERLEKILKGLTSFRELNNVLRANALKLLSSSSFEIEAFRIKLFEHVRFDISRIRSDLEGLMDQYKEERELIHCKLDSIKSSLDLGTDLSLPVKDYLKDNQESIDALNETFERSSQAYQQNIEENIKKVEDLCVKVESFRVKGYDLLNKYKRDSVLVETQDDIQTDYTNFLSLPLQEESKEISFNSLPAEDISTFSSSNMLLSKIDKQSKATVRLPHLIKTLERYLNNKYKDDLAALEKGNNPLPMQEYIYQSLFNESQLLADKKLTELMNTLKENQHDRRIKLYCRLLQVYDPNPISYKLSLYIIQMRNEFNRLVNKQVIPKTHTKRVDGMQVLNLLGAVRTLFGTDVETGKVVLKHLKPENMLSTVWTITCLEYFFYKNMVPDKCFLSITKQESMTEQEFVSGLSRLDTFVSEDDLQELFTSQFTGFISLQEFMNLFNLDSLFERNQIYLVDQLHFLNSLIEGYNAMRIRHYKEVEKLIQSKGGRKSILTWEEANFVLIELGSNADNVFGFCADVPAAELKKKIFELNIGGKGIGCYNLRVIKGISDTEEMIQAR